MQGEDRKSARLFYFTAREGKPWLRCAVGMVSTMGSSSAAVHGVGSVSSQPPNHLLLTCPESSALGCAAQLFHILSQIFCAPPCFLIASAAHSALPNSCSEHNCEPRAGLPLLRKKTTKQDKKPNTTKCFKLLLCAQGNSCGQAWTGLKQKGSEEEDSLCNL